MSSDIFFVEDWILPKERLSRFIKEAGGCVIALNVRAAYELEREGIPFKKQSDFYEYKQYENIGTENFEKVLTFIRHSDNRLKDRVGFIRAQELSLIETNYLEIKILFDQVFLKTFELKKILESLKPKRILFHGWPTRQTPQDSTYNNDESLYGPLLQIYSSHFQFELIHLESNPINSQKKPRAIPGWKTLLKASVRYILGDRFTQVSIFKNVILPVWWAHCINSCRPIKSRRHIFIGSINYDIPYVVHELIKQCVGPIYALDIPGRTITRLFPYFFWKKLSPPNHLQGNELKKACEDIKTTYTELFQDSETMKFLNFEGIDLSSILKPRLDKLFNSILPDSLDCYMGFTKTLSTYRQASLLVTSDTSSQLETVLCAAQRCKVRIYKYQHGSDGFFYFPLTGYYYLNRADYFLVYGQGVKRAYQKRFQKKIQIVPVGSAALDQLKKCPSGSIGLEIIRKENVNFHQPIVVYPLSITAYNRMYISYHFYPDDEYFSIHKRIVDTFRIHQNIQLIIKTHPSFRYLESPVVQYVDDQKIKNCHVVRLGRFIDLIPYAQMFISDAPSTVVLQAMTTSKKIMIYNGILRFEDEAREYIKKRCAYHENIDEFISDLNATLEERNFDTAPNDQEFLKEYGTFLNDGCSARRVMKKMAEY